MNMPFGMMALVLVSILIYFGIAQRVLDRMRLTDKQALWAIAAIVAGSFVDIPLMTAPNEVRINLGGAVVPALLSFWLLFTADQSVERIRGLFAAMAVAVVVALGARYLPYEPETMFIDPKLLYGGAAGLIAYLAGRSRRSAFIGGVLGIILSDIGHLVYLLRSGIPGTTDLGGAGAFDVTIIAGVVGVLLAEGIGETRERLQGGPQWQSRQEAGAYEFSREIAPTSKRPASPSPEEASIAPMQKKDGE